MIINSLLTVSIIFFMTTGHRFSNSALDAQGANLLDLIPKLPEFDVEVIKVGWKSYVDKPPGSLFLLIVNV